ncbi:cytoplasmic FMR1-interacting [Piromyces finnis]|uniref:Cytoplasmic FMR1-interacting n=1 Tax=Piromyces finnis TaxID=1754191 RepID=A0A1Y1VFG4_9FUNG|nr:cytoplasmic FMR1-interacting [Piromyces finnis]|eukprot:ORX54817.1 cytoplasmic FMR1-interacting [Piromyces finnis]
MGTEFKQYLNQLEMVVPFSEEPAIQTQQELYKYEKVEKVDFSNLENSCQYVVDDNMVQLKTEIKCIKGLSELINQGNDILNILYTYRSCSRIIPQVKVNDQENKSQLHLKTFEVLGTEIEKVKQLYQFYTNTSKELSGIMNNIMLDVDINVTSVSSYFCMTLAEFLDMAMTVDSVKMSKASLNNDFSMYRRAFSNLPKEYLVSIDKDTINDINQKLYYFLAEHYQFIQEIRRIFQNNSRLEEIFIEIMNFYCDTFENNQWLLPKERNTLLKAMAVGLFILDNKDDSRSIMKKKIKIERFTKFFKMYPIIPAFGDLQIDFHTFYSNVNSMAPHIDMKKYCDIDIDMSSRQYNICNFIEQTRNEYNNFICEYGLIMEKMRIGLTKKTSFLFEENKQIYNISLKGLQLLSKISCQLEDQIAWKLVNRKDVNPNSVDNNNTSEEENVTYYELALKDNLSNIDKNAIIEYICMIKTLSALLRKYISFQPTAINNYIYVEVQQFSKLSVQKCVDIAIKKKKPVSSIYSQILEIIEDSSIISSDKQKSDSDIPKRDVGLTKTQIFLVKYLLDLSFIEKNKSKNNFKKKDFPDVIQFMNKLFYFNYMLNMNETINECVNLTSLWYKEFFLDLSKKNHFPIETSLPMILISQILNSDSYNLIEYILYPLDIYNDAAQYILHNLHSKYLYDEIEAECEVCLHHFTISLSKKIFNHFKIHGTTALMGAELLNKTNKTGHFQKEYLPLDHYDSILKQKSFMLLGRNINISKIISENVTMFMKSSLENIITKFEQSDLTGVIDLDLMLQSSKMAHDLMSKYLTLEPFESLLMQVDESFSMVNFNGRIVSHIIAELYNNFLENWCYNSSTERFIRSQNYMEFQRANRKINTSFLYGSKSLYTTMNSINNIYKNFFGIQHFRSLLRVLKRESLATLICELECYERALLEEYITQYISVIQKGFPAIKLPMYQYGVDGAYEYFYHNFINLINYPDLDGVYKSFASFGNVFIFVFLLEKAIINESCKTKILTKNIWDNENKTFTLSSKLSMADEILESKKFQTNYKDLLDRFEYLTKINCNSNDLLLSYFIKKIQGTVEKLQLEWEKNGNEINVFFKVWSAIQFTLCVTSPKGLNNRELYGDGLQWSGCLLILLCNQVKSFIAFDYITHILNVNNYNMNKIKNDHRKEKETAVELSDEKKNINAFLEKANWYNAYNDEVFEIFSTHLK